MNQTALWLNAASHGLPSPEVRATISAHLALEQRLGPLAAAHGAADALADAHDRAAQLIGAPRETLRLTACTTEGWMTLAIGLRLAGRRVLVAPHEWGTNCRALAALGAQVAVLPPLGENGAGLAAWQATLPGAAALFLPMVSSVSGRVYPVAQIGALARQADCAMIVDAAQALGQIPIDVAALGCDALVATCRKWLRGPRGTGLAWVHPDLAARLDLAGLGSVDGNIALQLGASEAMRAALVAGPAALADQLGARRRAMERRAATLGLMPYEDALPGSAACTLGLPPDRVGPVADALAAAGLQAKAPDAARDEPFAPRPPGGLAPLRLSAHLDVAQADLDRAFAVIAAAL